MSHRLQQREQTWSTGTSFSQNGPQEGVTRRSLLYDRRQIGRVLVDATSVSPRGNFMFTDFGVLLRTCSLYDDCAENESFDYFGGRWSGWFGVATSRNRFAEAKCFSIHVDIIGLVCDKAAGRPKVRGFQSCRKCLQLVNYEYERIL